MSRKKDTYFHKPLVSNLSKQTNKNINLISGFASFRRQQRLNFLFRFIPGRAEDHSARLDALELAGLEVAEHDHHPVLHLLHRNEVDEAGDDRTSRGFAQVDLFDVKRFGLRVSADVDDSADADVESGRNNGFFGLKMVKNCLQMRNSEKISNCLKIFKKIFTTMLKELIKRPSLNKEVLKSNSTFQLLN